MSGDDDDDGVTASEDACSSSIISFDFLDGEFLAVILAFVTLVGSIVAYFYQRYQERKEQAEADKQKLEDIDRQQALERVRQQLSVYVGPLHRLYKTQNTLLAQYRNQTKKNMNNMLESLRKKGKTQWFQTFHNENLDPYIEDPTSLEARQYRSMVLHRLKPVYTQIRELVLNHASDLADMPTQEEWLQTHSKESLMSPYVGSININVMFDTFTVWTYEFDDIVESWNDGDFSRMQPTTKVAWMICNDIVDTLYDNAKMKEATYNNHVKVHRNTAQIYTIEELEHHFSGRRQSTIVPTPQL